MKYLLFEYDKNGKVWDLLEVTDDETKERFIAADDGFTTDWRDRSKDIPSYGRWLTKEEAFLHLL